MEQLICNMMQWADVSEAELAEKLEIPTTFGETLSWKYLCYVREPGLNAVIEGVVGAASRRGWNVVGFYDGFEGLLSEEGDERFEWLTPAACRGLRAKGGTILGTVNKGNFAIKVGVDLRPEEQGRFPLPGQFLGSD